ncbi:hypothetical protein CSKR_110477, partial [Clonorchis sinensis]
ICKKKQRTEGVEQLVSKILSSTLQKSRAYIPGTSKRHLSGPYEKYAKQFRDFCRTLLDRHLVQVEVEYLLSRRTKPTANVYHAIDDDLILEGFQDKSLSTRSLSTNESEERPAESRLQLAVEHGSVQG